MDTYMCVCVCARVCVCVVYFLGRQKVANGQY